MSSLVDILNTINIIINRKRKLEILLKLRDISINNIECKIGINCLNNYELEKILGTGSFGTIYTSCDKTNCDYATKIQIYDDEVFEAELEVMKKLNEDSRWNGVKLIHNRICKGYCNYVIPVNFGILVFDRWDGNIIGQDALISNNFNTFIDSLSTQIWVLHDNGYVHWDLLPKNVLFKKVGPKFSITDFGACKKENDEPYMDDYYDSYYFDKYNFQAELIELNITKDNIRDITKGYKGIVDYFILYKYIRKHSKGGNVINEFIKLLEKDNHKGINILKKHLNIL